MEQLEFKYIKTYSGFRGNGFLEQIIETKSILKELGKTLATESDYKKNHSIKQQIKRLKNDLDNSNVYNNRLIDTKNKLHQSAKEVVSLSKNDIITQQLISIFTKNRVEEPFIVATCPPIYRDSIAFFNDKQIVKIIHCCFECINIIDESNNDIFLSQKGFEDLQAFFIRLGHKINN